MYFDVTYGVIRSVPLMQVYLSLSFVGEKNYQWKIDVRIRFFLKISVSEN